MSKLTFDGQVAIVTGGGRNLGRAYCLDLARRGAAVVVSDVATEAERGSSAADAVVEEITSAGGRATACYESVATPEGAQAAVQTAVDSFGSVDAVVNNAGIMRNGFLEDLTAAKLDDVLAVNVRGSFLVTQAAWPVMRAKGYGRVVMISSAGGMFSFGGISNYAAAKAGVYGLTKALAFEGAPDGILVNVVLPRGGEMFGKDVNPPGKTPQSFGEALAAHRSNEAVAAIVSVLASRDCPVSGEAYSAGYGHFARVFVGLTSGWGADAFSVEAEDVCEHFEAIRALDGYSIPANMYDEDIKFAESLGVLSQGGLTA